MGQDDAGAGSPRAGLGVRSNLPAEISTFVGRAGDLARCADLLRRGRLLTLTGAGGAGKTRLALRLAAMLAARFPGGVWWVDLAPLTGREAVTGAVARAVPAVPAGADLDVMAEVLGEAGTLLVLDNCEHLSTGVAEFADRLLRGMDADRRPNGTGFVPLEPGQVGDLLADLVDASMVQFEEAAGTGRYRLLETIRAYAAARLADADETAELADRHLEWAADLAESLEAGAAAADPFALGQLEAEVANLHAALDHAASAAPASHAGLRLVAALGFFWVHRGYALAQDDRATRVIEAAPHAPAWLRARALQAHAYTCFYGADLDTADSYARAALELATAQPQQDGAPLIANFMDWIAPLEACSKCAPLLATWRFCST